MLLYPIYVSEFVSGVRFEMVSSWVLSYCATPVDNEVEEKYHSSPTLSLNCPSSNIRIWYIFF